MSERLKDRLRIAIETRAEFDRRAASDGGFAYSLASRSLAAHIDDLSQQLAAEQSRPAIELVELRLTGVPFENGTIPLRAIGQAMATFRQMIGHAALRISRGGGTRRRVPDHLYDELDLRLAALLSGSSRLIFTAAAHRDLLDDGLCKAALERVFRVLETNGTGSEFLESVSDLGPVSSKWLRELLQSVQKERGECEMAWRYSGETVKSWRGTREAIAQVAHALAVTEVSETQEVVLRGTVELLSKRERIHLRVPEEGVIRVLYPKRLLPAVSGLHLDQEVELRCSVTDYVNPFTGEYSTTHELLQVVN